MKARFLSFLLLLNGFACFGAVPQIDVDLDFQAPLNEFTLHIAEGTSPTIRANLFDDGSAFTATGWTGVLYLQASWSASTVIAITNSAVNASSLDFAMTAAHTSTTGTWAANFILTETDSGDLMEWSRGKVIFRDSPGTSGATAISLLTALNWDQFTFSGTDPWTEDLPVIIAGSGIEVTTNGVNRTIATTGAGPGDMTKAVYDTGDNGKVDTADNSDALGGTAAASYATDAEVASLYLPLAGSSSLLGDVIPATDQTIDLGSPSKQFDNIYGQNMTVAGNAVLHENSLLDASRLSFGEIPDARFPAVLPAISGANLTNLDASGLASGTVSAARLPGFAWMYAGTAWEGPFASSSGANVCGYTKYVVSGGSYESCAVAVETSQTSIQDKEFWCTIPVFADAAKTQLATSDAIIIRWMAANTSSAICKLDIWIYGDNGGTDTLVYSASGLTVTAANIPEDVEIARASLSSSTIYNNYKARARLYTKRDSSVNYKTGIISIRIKGEPI